MSDSQFFFTDGCAWHEVETKSGKKFFVEGHITTHDVDLVNDLVTAPAMSDMLAQIKSGNIKLDMDHDTWLESNPNKLPVGRIVDGKIDAKGIYIKAEINKDHPKFNDVWANIKSQMLDAFSIAYKAIKAVKKTVGNKVVRLLDEVKLLNVALTGNPINPEATMVKVFAKSLAALDDNIQINGGNTMPENIFPEGMNDENVKANFKSMLDNGMPREEALKACGFDKVEKKAFDDLKAESAAKDQKIAELKAELEKAKAPAADPAKDPAADPAPADPAEQVNAEVKAMLEKQTTEIAELKAKLENPVFKSMVESVEAKSKALEQVGDKKLSPLEYTNHVVAR